VLNDLRAPLQYKANAQKIVDATRTPRGQAGQATDQENRR